MGHNGQWVCVFFCGLMGYDGEGEDGFAGILLVWFGGWLGLSREWVCCLVSGRCSC